MSERHAVPVQGGFDARRQLQEASEEAVAL